MLLPKLFLVRYDKDKSKRGYDARFLVWPFLRGVEDNLL